MDRYEQNFSSAGDGRQILTMLQLRGASDGIQSPIAVRLWSSRLRDLSCHAGTMIAVKNEEVVFGCPMKLFAATQVYSHFDGLKGSKQTAEIATVARA